MATDYRMGDYRIVAKKLLPASVELADFCSPSPGDLVIDVAAGSGNLSRVCRDRGTRVVAVDRVREQLLLGADDPDGIGWVTGDALALPVRDGVADAALSVFGVVYAENPDTATTELVRVCRPGGTIGLTCWLADGYQNAWAALFYATMDFTPVIDWLTVWGSEDAIRQQLSPYADDVEVRVAELVDRHASLDDWWQARERTPPLENARAQLDDAAYDELGRRLRALATEYGEHDDGFLLRDRYLLARARVR